MCVWGCGCGVGVWVRERENVDHAPTAEGCALTNGPFSTAATVVAETEVTDVFNGQTRVWLAVGAKCTPTCGSTMVSTFNVVGECSGSASAPASDQPDTCATACPDRAGATCTELSLESTQCCSNVLGGCDHSGNKFIRKCEETLVVAGGLTPEPSATATCSSPTADIYFNCNGATTASATAGVLLPVLAALLLR